MLTDSGLGLLSPNMWQKFLPPDMRPQHGEDFKTSFDFGVGVRQVDFGGHSFVVTHELGMEQGWLRQRSFSSFFIHKQNPLRSQ